MTPLGKPRTHRATPAQVILRWGSTFFFIVGIVALGYVSITLLDARFYQGREARTFEEARRTRETAQATGGLESPLSSVPLSQPNRTATQRVESIRGSAAWGRIEIKSLGLSSMIMEGVDRETLRRGVGHVPGTALPSQSGNVALAGHRDTLSGKTMKSPWRHWMGLSTTASTTLRWLLRSTPKRLTVQVSQF
jgi:sortase A